MNIQKEANELRNLRDKLLGMKALYSEQNTTDTIDFLVDLIDKDLETDYKNF